MPGDERAVDKLDDMNIAQALQQIRRDLDGLAEKARHNFGYRKKIAHALERVAAIERHLGIERKIDA